MAKEIKLTKGLVALVDDDDYEIVVQFSWCASQSRRGGKWYAVRRLPGTGQPGKRQYLHRFIMGDNAPSIDHVNCDGLDCRRANMRVATVAQNSANRGKQRDNTSGFKGVHLHMSQRSVTPGWVASIKRDGKMIYLGIFRTPEEAAQCYDAAAIRLHGEFARLNFELIAP